MSANQDTQSRLLPILLLIAGVFGAVYSIENGSALAFACWCGLAAIGSQELKATDLHESGESSGF